MGLIDIFWGNSDSDNKNLESKEDEYKKTDENIRRMAIYTYEIFKKFRVYCDRYLDGLKGGSKYPKHKKEAQTMIENFIKQLKLLEKKVIDYKKRNLKFEDTKIELGIITNKYNQYMEKREDFKKYFPKEKKELDTIVNNLKIAAR
jgi:hypothetical protein